MRITEYGMMLEHDELRPSGSIGWHTMITFCHCHNKFEEVKPDFHVVCFECGHVYNTPQELEEAYKAIVEQMDDSKAQPRKADEIFFCQECMHDF